MDGKIALLLLLRWQLRRCAPWKTAAVAAARTTPLTRVRLSALWRTRVRSALLRMPFDADVAKIHSGVDSTSVELAGCPLSCSAGLLSIFFRLQLR